MNAGRDAYACTLPGGYLDADGSLHREAELEPLSGREEELLAARAERGAAELVTEVLCRCVRRVGSIAPVTAEVARRLLVADRQYLLLKLRELTFGDRVEGTLQCPWPECGARVDVDFAIGDVPVRAAPEVRASYEVALTADAADGEPAPRTIAFRLPNGADQEALAPVLVANPARALAGLLERCLVGPDGAEVPDAAGLVAALAPAARQELERAIEERAPRVDLDMELGCPECGRGFTAPLDVQDFFFGELRTSRDLLYRQVHYLAYHYHWSEREILDMPRDKRLAYIEILADEIEAMNDALGA